MQCRPERAGRDREGVGRQKRWRGRLCSASASRFHHVRSQPCRRFGLSQLARFTCEVNQEFLDVNCRTNAFTIMCATVRYTTNKANAASTVNTAIAGLENHDKEAVKRSSLTKDINKAMGQYTNMILGLPRRNDEASRVPNNK